MFTHRKLFHTFTALHLLIGAGLLCGGSRALAGGRAAGARREKPAPAAVQTAQTPAPAVASIIPCIYQTGANPSGGPTANRICLPPPPPNATVDTNSEQVIYGVKYFTQPISGDLVGSATYATEFTTPLSGDVVGTQGATRIDNVPASALPSIGHGPGNAARVQYVFADADPNDPRADGSLAHPYSRLWQASQNARNGDRIIVQGVHNGTIVFNRIVSIEGAGPESAILYGTLEFSGYGSSRIRGMRVNCTSSTPCVLNRAVSGGGLTLENVEVAQSYQGSALSSVSGPVVAIRSGFVNVSGGNAVLLEPYAAGESRFVDSSISTPAGGIALAVTGKSLRIDNSTVSTGGKDPAIHLTEVEKFTAHGLTSTSAGFALHLRNTRVAMVYDSVFTPGYNSASIDIQNDPISTFAAVRGPGLLFVNNTFASDVPEVFNCGLPAEIATSGNLVPLFPSPVSTKGPVGPVPESQCNRVTFAGF